MDEPLDYSGPHSDPLRLSKLALISFLASIAGPFLGGLVLAIGEMRAMTPAKAEYIELACETGPALAAAVLAVIALFRIHAYQGQLRGKGWAIGGFIIGVVLAAFLFIAIVASHSWLD